MSKIRPFRGVRPTPEIAGKVASLPYDVMSSDEARVMAEGNPLSFLHVTKPEIDLDPAIDIYDPQVYEKGRVNFAKLRSDGVMIQDKTPCYYLYAQVMDGRRQVGLVAGTSIEDYENDIIKKHELTRADKEADRCRHVDILNANTGPVFLTYPADDEMNRIQEQIQTVDPMVDFVSSDGIRHSLWKIDDPAMIDRITKLFERIPCLYVADGHHRSAAGTKVGQERRAKNPHHTGDEEYNYFLSVIFPHNHLYIMDYNRVVKDLNGHTMEQFLKAVGEKFDIAYISKTEPYKPMGLHEFAMVTTDGWSRLTPKPGSFPANDPVRSLDVAILQENLLDPILGIKDPRKDKRIDFVGGIRGLGELQRRVDAGEAVAFALSATTIEQLMAIADAGMIMPPKSTWFEPKLRCGMVVHMLDE
jgi:uncharacterized protein (DUF1015 family)